jgi:hypothetical protein
MHAKKLRAFSWVLYWFAIPFYTENARQNLASVFCARAGREFVIRKPENARKNFAGISCAREGRKGGVFDIHDMAPRTDEMSLARLWCRNERGTNPLPPRPYIYGKVRFPTRTRVRPCISRELAWAAVRPDRSFVSVHLVGIRVLYSPPPDV